MKPHLKLHDFFQQHLPGHDCFGCGTENSIGLKIESYWKDDIALCRWHPQPHHQGWRGLTCGGIIATLVDCHCIATASATAVRNENRPLGSEPHYLFATGSINLRFLKPSPITNEIELRAKVNEIKNERKYKLDCQVYVQNEKTADAQVIALLVYRSDRPHDSAPEFRPG